MNKNYSLISKYMAICDYKCAGCVLYQIQKEKGRPSDTSFCFGFASSNPEENGAAIGFEPWKEKVKLPKNTIKDMTLGEMKNYCEAVQAKNKKCSACDIKGNFGVCPFDGVKPPMWNFDGPPKFTEEERVSAKVIREMFPGVVSVYREKGTEELKMLDKVLNITVINKNMFPTIKSGMSALLDEIIGDVAWEE